MTREAIRVKVIWFGRRVRKRARYILYRLPSFEFILRQFFEVLFYEGRINCVDRIQS